MLAAVEVASSMQVEVTQQRNEVDSLCSKVRQHVEALEACRKVRRNMSHMSVQFNVVKLVYQRPVPHRS